MNHSQFKSVNKKEVIVVCLFFLFVLLSVASYGQSIKKRQAFYKGIDVSFGARTYDVTSNIAEINNILLVTEGGSAGIVYGNEIIRSKVNAGFFYSSDNVPQTIDQFHVSKVINFYPLTWLKKDLQKFEFYVLGGANYNVLKFAGTYLEEHQQGKTAVNDDYIGKVKQVNVNLGAGIEYKLFDNREFMHLYAEVQRSFKAHTASSNAEFANTKANGQMIYNIGIRFGIVNY